MLGCFEFKNDETLRIVNYLLLENGVFWNTGDESDEHGHISEDPVNRIQMMDKRQKKVEQILTLVPKNDQAVAYGKSDICIVSWGSPKGPILDAIEMHRKEGHEIGFIDIKLLEPFPTEHIKSLQKNFPVGEIRSYLKIMGKLTW